MKPAFHVYILQDATGAFYVGHTEDLAARVLAHQAGQGGVHTKKLIAIRLVYSESQPDLAAAINRERSSKDGVAPRSAR